jgi:hypothetical protein
MNTIDDYLNKFKHDKIVSIIRKDLTDVKTLGDRQALSDRYVSAAIKKAIEDKTVLYLYEEQQQKMIYDLNYHKDAFINGRCANEVEMIQSLLTIYRLTYKLENSRTMSEITIYD